jgi:hypothetical protein
MKRQSKPHRQRRAKSLVDLTGRRFGKWLVLKDAGKRIYYSGGHKVSEHMWVCRCDCGVEKQVSQGNLTGSRSTQCNRCAVAKRRMPRTKLYDAWYRLKAQRELPETWQEFAAFQRAVGDPPDSKARLIRCNLNKPHSPENTRWAPLGLSRQVRRKFWEEHILHDRVLMNLREAKARWS